MIGQRNHPLARHRADRQKRAAFDLARFLHGVKQPLEVADLDFKIVPIFPAKRACRRQRHVLAAAVADHDVRAYAQPLHDGVQSVARYECGFRAHFDAEEILFQPLFGCRTLRPLGAGKTLSLGRSPRSVP